LDSRVFHDQQLHERRLQRFASFSDIVHIRLHALLFAQDRLALLQLLNSENPCSVNRCFLGRIPAPDMDVRDNKVLSMLCVYMLTFSSVAPLDT
jgi:hypothetical protein